MEGTRTRMGEMCHLTYWEVILVFHPWFLSFSYTDDVAVMHFLIWNGLRWIRCFFYFVVLKLLFFMVKCFGSFSFFIAQQSHQFAITFYTDKIFLKDLDSVLEIYTKQGISRCNYNAPLAVGELKYINFPCLQLFAYHFSEIQDRL